MFHNKRDAQILVSYDGQFARKAFFWVAAWRCARRFNPLKILQPIDAGAHRLQLGEQCRPASAWFT